MLFCWPSRGSVDIQHAEDALLQNDLSLLGSNSLGHAHEQANEDGENGHAPDARDNDGDMMAMRILEIFLKYSPSPCNAAKSLEMQSPPAYARKAEFRLAELMWMPE